MFLTLQEKKTLAELLNARIDIPWVPESMEGPAFLFAVNRIEEALEGVMPEAIGELLRDGSKGIDPAEAQALGNRLLVALNKRIDLPLFNEEQEADLLQRLIAPLVVALSDGHTIDTVIDATKQKVAEDLARR